MAGGVGGPGKATTVALDDPCGVSFGAGRVYIADGTTVRAVDPSNDYLTTPAGTGSRGPLHNGARATKASLNTCGVAVDHSGNLVIANGGLQGRNRILVAAASTGTFDGVAMKAGHLYAVAGNGTAGFSGDGGPAAGAELSSPRSVTVDAAGNLVIADSANNRIRVVAERTGTFYGQAMTAGDIYTVAGHGAVGGIGGFSGDGADGNLVIADTEGSRIRVVAVRAGTFYGKAMAAGDIYAVAGAGRHGLGNGGPATRATLASPEGVAADGANLLIADANDNRIQQVTG